MLADHYDGDMNHFSELLNEEVLITESPLTIDLCGRRSFDQFGLEQTIGDDWTNLLFAAH